MNNTSHVIHRRPLPGTLPSLGDIHPVLARLYAARKITDPTQLEYGLKHLLPYQDLKGIDAAVELLVTALQQQQQVLVVGDFDVDGATSTTLALEALRTFGLRQVDYL
ncbi:MAG: single-stranded-DNA-specific exonuclease RecJ, partial [Halobacteria archaeon]|nr:single-stranded-DNA-specific exonuclease RecJ [Halobacteria archaeon]